MRPMAVGRGAWPYASSKSLRRRPARARPFLPPKSASKPVSRAIRRYSIVTAVGFTSAERCHSAADAIAGPWPLPLRTASKTALANFRDTGTASRIGWTASASGGLTADLVAKN